MKGLLVKDFKLMKNMRNSIIIIVLISVAMSTYISDLSFIIVYMALIGVTFTMSTLSYDEYDNGYSFLLSLPVTRKSYVTEKYGFGLIFSVGAWLAGAVIVMAAELAKQTLDVHDMIMTSLGLLPSAFLLLAVMMPLRLKFGSEKGRIVMIGAMGVVFGITFIAAKIVSNLDLDLSAAGERLLVLSEEAVTAAAILIALLLLFLSYRISISIMEKKEF